MRASMLSVTIGISIKLLEKIVRPLKDAGLVHSVRGATGGYVLGRPPAQITLADVLTSMEGAVFKPQCCEADADCPLMEGCPTGSIWTDIARHLEQKFRATTLADFMVQPRENCPSRAGRAARVAAVTGLRLEPAAPKGSSRISRRRKPGSGQIAPRVHARPRLA